MVVFSCTGTCGRLREGDMKLGVKDGRPPRHVLRCGNCDAEVRATNPEEVGGRAT